MASGKHDDCVATVAKYLLFSFNFIFWLTGITFIAIGVWAYLEKHTFDHKGKLKDDFNLYNITFDVAILTVCLGSAIFVISFSGCVGALRENVCLLKFFSYSMAVILLAQLVLAVLAFVFSQQVQNRVTTVLETEAILRYRTDLDLENLVDWIQLTFSCCGFGERGYMDWSLNVYFNCSASNPSYERCAVPYSCCHTPLIVYANLSTVDSMCGFNVQSMEYEDASRYVYTHGCIETVLNRARSNLYAIGGVAIGLSIPQLLGIILARILADKIEGQAGRTIAYV